MHKDKTRWELYLMLKEKAPDLAKGKTRARREELEALLRSESAVEMGEVMAADFLLRMARIPKRAKKSRTRKAGFDFPKPPQEAIEKTRRGLEMLELAANAIKMSGLSETQIGTLLYIVRGLDAEAAGKAVFGLIGLKDALTSPKEQAA